MRATRVGPWLGLSAVAAALGLAWIGSACTGGTAIPGGGGGQNVLLTDAISFDGTISGKLYDAQTTRESLDATSAGQDVPSDIDTENATVEIHDVEGNTLVDESGEPIGEVTVNEDGSFTVEDVPVGTDITVCGDLDGDGICDVESCVNVPAEEGTTEGELTDVRVDPLTTMVLAKLRELIEERGIDPQTLGISPAAVVSRIVDAYTHLFEESGIEHEVTLEEIAALSAEDLAALFDAVIPAGAQVGMLIVEGNLDAALATDAEALALAAAKVFLQAGFPIVDHQGGVDLSALADVEGVLATTPEEFFADDGFKEFDEMAGGPMDGGPGIGGPGGERPGIGGPGGPVDGQPPTDGVTDGDADEGTDTTTEEDATTDDDETPAQMIPAFENAVLYVSETAEPDRNHTAADEDGEDEGGEEGGGMPMRPGLNDHLILQMALLQQENRSITLGDLYELLTSIDDGLGARLIYFLHDPNFFGPPLAVFETQDGRGLAISLDRIFMRLADAGFNSPDPTVIEQRQTALRQLLGEVLGDTLAPEFGRFFDGFISDRLGSVEELAARIRDARAHLPFNRSGSSTFFVVADGDPLQTDGDASAVTVDAEITPGGEVASVTYNASGTGAFYMGFTQRTEEGGVVELIVRETGRRVHGRRGPARLSMFDEEIFQPVDGVSFAEVVSETGSFFPATHVTVITGGFRPDPAPAEAGVGGPNGQILVLATEPGRNSEPVRVDYDSATGQATYNSLGRNLLMFLPDSQDTGVFALFNEDSGRPAGMDDPTDFFRPRPERPDDFEDTFNEQQPEDGSGGTVPPPPDDEVTPPTDDETPPTDDQTSDDDQSTDDGDAETDTTPDDGDGLDPSQAVDDGDGTTGDDSTSDDSTDDGTTDDGTTGDGTTDDGTTDDGVTDDQMPDDTTDDGSTNDGSTDDGTSSGELGDRPALGGGFDAADFILIHADEIVGLEVEPAAFTRVFGTEVANERYQSDFDPFYDDVNANGVQDDGEPTSPFRPTLFHGNDWRATDIRLYYRRADDGSSVSFEEVDFESDTPQTRDGVELVARNFVPRLNAARFGRPNTAVNLLTAFLPPDYFDGQHDLTIDTPVDIFTAIALINLVMDQVVNVEADVDVDGEGPLPAVHRIIDAQIFIAPIGDPFRLLIDGFRDRSILIDGSNS
ncbi:MAG: hypothetical protein HOP29_09800 [Phycisphaerales bacterium]|nr:hypothetical protein [Phycisphaerales bacterium]